MIKSKAKYRRVEQSCLPRKVPLCVYIRVIRTPWGETGTGKTLTSAVIIKLFLKTQNATRVLFLVDRLELEDQALKAFKKARKDDYKSVIYKENRDDWRHAEIVVTTVQSLLFNNKYRQLFSPTDFDLVISDEAHRSIGGNARAVFDYASMMMPIDKLERLENLKNI